MVGAGEFALQPDDLADRSDGPDNGPGAVQSAVLEAREPDNLPDDLPDGRASSEPQRVVLMGAGEQIREFLAWMLADDLPVVFPTRRMLAQYHGWAREARVVQIPDVIFLKVLGEHRSVTKQRVRVKDPKTGRVPKNANGTPLRDTVYTLSPRRDAPMPGRVPVGPLVDHWELPPVRVKRAA